MPIEFPCPICHQQVRTPDEVAGKKGQCPHCGTLVMIPAPVVVAPSTAKLLESKLHTRPPDPARLPPGHDRPAAKAASPAGPAPPAGSIEFPCPECHQTVRTPAAAAGKKGQCPHCCAIVQIPAQIPAQLTLPLGESRGEGAVTGTKPPALKPAAPASPTTPAKPAKMAVARALPTAKPIPAKPVSQADPEILDLEELPPERPGSILGLTPLGSGLVPLGPAQHGPAPLASFGGLTPLGPAPPAPASPDPFAGLTPLSAYPAVTPPPTNPLGSPGSPFGPSANPYAAPALYAQPAYQAPVVSDAHRKGLPWERDPSMEAFNETMSVVLGSPQEAFSTMRRTGGVGSPIGFMIIGMVIGQIAYAIYGTIFSIIRASASEEPLNIEFLVLGGAGQLVGAVVGAVIFAPLMTFVIAGIYHLLLALVGGANAGYEATFRSVCFVNGSTSILLAIPCIGPILAFFFSIFCLIHAFAGAHETSGGKAAFSVLGVLIGLVVCGCGCVIMFVLPAISSAMNQLP